MQLLYLPHTCCTYRTPGEVLDAAGGGFSATCNDTNNSC